MILLWSPPKMAKAALPKAMSVVLVENERSPTTLKEPKKPMEEPKPVPAIKPLPKPLPKPKIEPKSEPLSNVPPVPEVSVSPSDEPQTEVQILQSDEFTVEPGQGVPRKSHIPSRWALKPPLAPKRLEGLGFSQKDIECLTSLEEDCKDLRQNVFAEYRLTETELVWTPNRPDTGLSSQFYGLSEAEIREKLSIPTAGQNGLYIPFTNIGIGGPLMDKLSGVNKTCKSVPAIIGPDKPNSGQVGYRRVCD